MKRREFIMLLGGSAAAWPITARAQQQKPAMPVIGFLAGVTPAVVERPIAEFQRALSDAGFVAGKNITIEYRWAEGQYGRLPDLAADLIQRGVAVIVTVGGDPPALAAKRATSSIPIVFMIGADPIKIGLVGSFNRPGGNATGVNLFIDEMEPKRMELLLELVPNVKKIALLVNPRSVAAKDHIGDIAAATRGRELETINVTSGDEIEVEFAKLAQRQVGAVHVVADPFLFVHRNLIVSLAARYSLPATYAIRGFAEAGGLISYGTSLSDAYRQVGDQVAKILRGAKPADMPVMQPTKFELVINLKTAKALGLTVPPTLLARADEVIE